MKTTLHHTRLAETGIEDLGQVAGMVATRLTSLCSFTVQGDKAYRTDRALWVVEHLTGREPITFYFSFDREGMAISLDPAVGMVYTRHAYELTAHLEDGAAILTMQKILREG